MSTIYLEDIVENNKKNENRNIDFIRKNYDSSFYYGKRDFDKPRRNPVKQKALMRYGRL